MRLLIIGLILPLLLPACAAAPSSGGFAVINYSQAVMDLAADEIEGGACPALNSMMIDYKVLRDQARVR